MTTKQKLIERIERLIDEKGCSVIPRSDSVAYDCYDAIAQAWLEDVEKSRANENQECQKIVQSLFSTPDQLGQMRARLLRAKENKTNE